MGAVHVEQSCGTSLFKLNSVNTNIHLEKPVLNRVPQTSNNFLSTSSFWDNYFQAFKSAFPKLCSTSAKHGGMKEKNKTKQLSTRSVFFLLKCINVEVPRQLYIVLITAKYPACKKVCQAWDLAGQEASRGFI